MHFPLPCLRRLMLALSICVAVATSQDAIHAKDADTKNPPDDPFFEPVTPLKPKHARTEAEIDRVQAAAQFSHGRLLLQRGKDAEALREFQRAWRLDPSAVSILDEVIPLAYKLRRPEVSARYAVIQAEAKPDDPVMLRRLAELLTSQGDAERALSLFELAMRSGDEPGSPKEAAETLREMAGLYLLTGNSKQAAETYTKFLDAVEHPEKSKLDDKTIKELLGRKERTFLLIAESCLEAGRYDEAEKHFRTADDADPHPAQLALHLARVDAARGKTKAALKKLDEYFAGKDASVGSLPYSLLSELLSKQHKDPEVARAKLIERLETLRGEDEKNVDLLYYLAQQLAAADRLEAAAKAYSAAIPLLDDAQDARAGLIEVERRIGEAAPLLTALGELALVEGRLDAVEDSVEKIVADKKLTGALLDPGWRKSAGPGEFLAAAYVALAAEKFDVADELIELAAKEPAPPQDEVLSSLGLALLDAKRYDRAAEILLRAAEATAPEQSSVKAFRNVYASLALELAGKTDEALATVAKAVKLSDAPRVQMRTAWILAHAKRLAEAQAAYEALIKKFDDNHSSLDTRDVIREARMMVSSVCAQQDNMPQAEEWLEQVLDEFPEDVGALNDLGYLWAEQGKHLNRSLEMTTKAVAAEPDNAAYLDSLGWAYYRLGQFDKAIEYLEQATQGEDPDGVLLDHLGDAYAGAKQADKALATWRRAVTAFEREPDAEQLEKTKRKIEQHAGDKSGK